MMQKKTCSECHLIMGNKNNGFRFGNPKAKLVILRPFPTRQECNGNPNTRQNTWLVNQLKLIGLSEEDYHIVNVINCYPNRPATKDEVAHCSSHLNTVIKTKPKIVMTLGVDAYNYMTGYKIKSVAQVYNGYVKGVVPAIVANYTVGQAMSKQEIRDIFTKNLYTLKNIYRMLINIEL